MSLLVPYNEIRSPPGMTLSLCLLVMILMRIILANSLDPDPEAQQNVGPDLSQTVWHDTLMLFLKEFLKNVNLEEK